MLQNIAFYHMQIRTFPNRGRFTRRCRAPASITRSAEKKRTRASGNLALEHIPSTHQTVKLRKSCVDFTILSGSILLRILGSDSGPSAVY